MSSADGSEDRLDLDELTDGVEGRGRRDFIKKITALCGLPVAAALLGGCDGGGLLDNDPPDHPRNGAAGDLQTALLQFRALLAQQLEDIRLAGGRDNVNIAGLLGAMNPQFAAVWLLMIAASAAELRSHVAPDMQQLLDGIDPNYEGPAREVTEQQLRGARAGADELIDAESPTEEQQGVWVYLVMSFLLFPTLAEATALGWAQEAWRQDTENRALTAWFWLNSSTAHPWSATLIAEMIALFVAISLNLYTAMGTTHLAGAPGLLFGRNWAALLMLMLVLLTATWTGGSG